MIFTKQITWLPGLAMVLAGLLFRCPVATATLLGTPATELHIKEWIKGEPIRIKVGATRQIVILEFWKTSCPHCLESIPLLEMLQDRYRNQSVVVVGITDEDPAEVKHFLEKDPIGSTATYHIAVDNEGKTYKSYMERFGVSGVPHAFVIDKEGQIVWVGHPLSGLEKVVEELLTDRFDLRAAQAVLRANKLFEPYMYMAIRTDEQDLTHQMGERLVHYAKTDAPLLDRFAWQIANNKRIGAPDLELAHRAIKQAYAITQGRNRSVLETYAQVLQKMGNDKAAEAMRSAADRLKVTAAGKAKIP